MNTIPTMIDASGMSDADLARLTGCHPATIMRWRRGSNLPVKASQIAVLARALDVSPAMIRPDLAAIFRERRHD